jgi:hypothetical protein
VNKHKSYLHQFINDVELCNSVTSQRNQVVTSIDRRYPHSIVRLQYPQPKNTKKKVDTVDEKLEITF